MNKLYLLLIILAATKNYSQDQELLQNTWYLSEYIKDDISYYPPSSSSTPYVSLNFFSENSEQKFSTTVCNTLTAADVSFDDINSTFSYYNSIITLGTCPNPADQFFDGLYLPFFFPNNTLIVMLYSITEDDEELTLTITSVTGDKTIYGSQLLGNNNSHEVNKAVLYPNPTSSILYLQLPNYPQQDVKIEISTVAGQILFEQAFTTIPEGIDLTGFASGIYIVRVNIGDELFCNKVVKY